MAAQPVGRQREVEHVVGTKVVVEHDAAAVSSLCGHGDGRVGLVRRGEIEVLGDDIVLLSCQKEVHLLVFTVKEGDVLVAVLVGKILNDSLRDGAALGIERQFHLAVLEHHLAFLAAQCCIEHIGGIVLGSFFGLRLPGGFFGLLLLRVILHDSGYAVFHSLGFYLLRRGLVVPAEAYQHQCNQYKSNDCVSVHFYSVFIIYKPNRLQRYEDF